MSLRWRRFVGAVWVLVVLAAGLALGSGAGAAAQPALAGEVGVRDRLVADQENLLNAYRCMFGVDTEAVPGECPDPDLVSPGAAPPNPTQQDIDARDALIASQEELLNVYRCRYGIDTELVPEGCTETAPTPETEPVDPPSTPEPVDPPSTPEPVDPPSTPEPTAEPTPEPTPEPESDVESVDISGWSDARVVAEARLALIDQVGFSGEAADCVIAAAGVDLIRAAHNGDQSALDRLLEFIAVCACDDPAPTSQRGVGVGSDGLLCATELVESDSIRYWAHWWWLEDETTGELPGFSWPDIPEREALSHVTRCLREYGDRDRCLRAWHMSASPVYYGGMRRHAACVYDQIARTPPDDYLYRLEGLGAPPDFGWAERCPVWFDPDPSLVWHDKCIALYSIYVGLDDAVARDRLGGECSRKFETYSGALQDLRDAGACIHRYVLVYLSSEFTRQALVDAGLLTFEESVATLSSEFNRQALVDALDLPAGAAELPERDYDKRYESSWTRWGDGPHGWSVC